MNLDLEYKIFGCLFTNNELIKSFPLEEKYFKEKGLLKLFKSIYEEIGLVDSQTLSTYSSDKVKFKDIMLKLLSEDVYSANIDVYYKQLKLLYAKRMIEKACIDLNSGNINLDEFNELSNQLCFELKKSKYIIPIQDIEINDDIEREYIGIKELDYYLKGIEYGKLHLWSGITNHGKTTIMIQFAKNLVKEHKKVFYFCGEQTASEFKTYIYTGLVEKDKLVFKRNVKDSRIYDVTLKSEDYELLDSIYANELFIYNNDNIKNDINSMIRALEYAFKQGVRIFFIDNFMQLDESEKIEEQTQIVEQFKRFARDRNVIINLVAHPRKTQFKCRLSIFDVAGTMNIANKSSNICSIIRKDMIPSDEYEEIEKVLSYSGYFLEECDGIIEVLKTKGNLCKMVGLKYDHDTKQYVEASKYNEKTKEYLENKYAKKGGRGNGK